jgi:hypothetical protein
MRLGAGTEQGLQFPGHTPHVVWYDDVVVAASRVGCN